MDLEQAGSLIQARREKLDISQDVLAKASSIGRPSLSLLENGHIEGDMGYGKVYTVMKNLGIVIPDIIDIGKIIREQRDRFDVSQDTLVQQAVDPKKNEKPIGRPTLSQLETGKLPGDIGFSKVCRLLVAVGVELEYEITPPLVEQRRRRSRRHESSPSETACGI